MFSYYAINNQNNEVTIMSVEKSEVVSTKKPFLTLELIVVIMLGVTAIFTAWASWVSSAHNSNQDDNFIRSNHLSAEGNSEYNAGIQELMMDMMLYNNVNSLLIDLHFAEEFGDSTEAEKLEWKIDELVEGNMSAELVDAFDWALAESDRRGEHVSPFDKEGFTDAYFEYALDLLHESEEALAQGQLDSAYSTAFGLATVIYAVVLFLLGIVTSFPDERYKKILICVSCVAFLGATIYMLTIPLPVGLFG